jgi:hypothetical protein
LNGEKHTLFFNYIKWLSCFKNRVIQKFEPMGIDKIYNNVNILCSVSLIRVQNFELSGA